MPSNLADRLSLREFFKLYFRHIHRVGEDMLSVNGEKGVRRYALLFPIEKRLANKGKETHWVSMDVLDDYVAGRIDFSDEVFTVNSPF